MSNGECRVALPTKGRVSAARIEFATRHSAYDIRENYLSPMEFLGAYARLVANLRVILFYMAVLVAVLCAIDWAVRTRRVNPFSKIARFFRANIDPILAPI